MANNIVKYSFWSISQRYIPSIIHIVATLFITRMINPSDFGEVALVTTFCQISILIVSSGLGEGLMYKVNNSEILLSSVFYFNLVVGLVLYIILFFLAPTIADFYGIERIELLTRVTSLSIIIYSLTYVQRIIFQKQLKFHILAVVSLIASILGSLLGIILALCGLGIWSIVALTITINCIELILLWSKSSWMPQLLFSLKELKEILAYSMKILITNFVQVIYDNLYSLIIGKIINTRCLGYYNRMQTVVYYTTTNFMYSIESVFFPILCKNKNDKSVLLNSFEKVLRISTLITSFVLIILIGLSEDIVLIVLTDRWKEGAPVLQYLAIAFLFVPISYVNNSFMKISGNTKELLIGNIIRKGIGLLILAVTCTMHNFEIICIGIIIYYFLESVISILYSHHYLGIPFYKQCFYLMNNTIVVLVSIATLYALKLAHMQPINNIICGTTLVFLLHVLYHSCLSSKEWIISKKLIINKD